MTLVSATLARLIQGIASGSGPDAWMQMAFDQQVDGLICHAQPELAQTEPEFFKQSQRRTFAAAARHALQISALKQFARALGEQQAIVFKGMAVAQFYPSPALRHKVDVDVLIRADQRERWFAALLSAGFTTIPSNYSSTVLPERTFRLDLGGSAMHIDLHWQLSGRPLLAHVLSFDALAVNATSEGNLLYPDAIDALLIACAHRVGHHRGHERLLWLYDIALLHTHVDSEALFARAQARGLCGIVADGLGASLALFQFESDPDTLLERLRAHAGSETASRLLTARNNFPFDWATSNWATRGKLISERLWAEPSYLRARFGDWPLPFLQMARWLQFRRGIRAI